MEICSHEFVVKIVLFVCLFVKDQKLTEKRLPIANIKQIPTTISIENTVDVLSKLQTVVVILLKHADS